MEQPCLEQNSNFFLHLIHVVGYMHVVITLVIPNYVLMTQIWLKLERGG